MKKLKQCRSCPWRVGCVPNRDIPNYSVALHVGLADTIRSGLDSLRGPSRIMACHYARPDNEFPCAGWLHQQLGDGNNIAMRIAVATGHFSPPEVKGPQHERFEDTLGLPPVVLATGKSRA